MSIVTLSHSLISQHMNNQYRTRKNKEKLLKIKANLNRIALEEIKEKLQEAEM